ncbi:hypothetical protein MRB53_038280 [Persea americana]|nr:hypothetical protein MRB53_038280 [Persea americana]
MLSYIGGWARKLTLVVEADEQACAEGAQGPRDGGVVVVFIRGEEGGERQGGVDCPAGPAARAGVMTDWTWSGEGGWGWRGDAGEAGGLEGATTLAVLLREEVMVDCVIDYAGRASRGQQGHRVALLVKDGLVL